MKKREPFALYRMKRVTFRRVFGFAARVGFLVRVRDETGNAGIDEVVSISPRFVTLRWRA